MSSTEIAKIPEKPSWLVTDEERTGLEGLARIVRPSFLKIIHDTSAKELRDEFGEGSIVMTPDMVQVTTFTGPGVSICPLLYYVEYCKWSSIWLKGTEPMIAERSFDPRSSVALKSVSPATWSEEHPNHRGDEKYNYRYCEHLNFIVKLMEPDLLNYDPCLISFAKTNYVVGAKFAKQILARKQSIYAGRYLLGTRIRKGNVKDSLIYSTENDPEQPWIDTPEMYEQLKAAHVLYSGMFKAQTLDVQYDDLAEIDPSQVVDEASQTY